MSLISRFFMFKKKYDAQFKVVFDAITNTRLFVSIILTANIFNSVKQFIKSLDNAML